jgi:hypothetical protein
MSTRTRRIVNPNMITDAVYYAQPNSGASVDKAQGVIIGCVSALMGAGLTYAEAIGMVGRALRPGYRDDALPPAWAYDLVQAYNTRL